MGGNVRDYHKGRDRTHSASSRCDNADHSVEDETSESRDVTRDDAADEFASTYQEWHYLVGGFSLGFIVGWLAKAVLRRL